MEISTIHDPQQGAALMNRSPKYVALDVHQATTVVSVRAEHGRVIDRRVLPTEAAALTTFVRGLRGAIHVVFEEGTQAQWLYDLLSPLVERVVVCDRRGARGPGNKGDQVDADHLAEQLRRGGLRAVYHGSPQRATLKELTRAYQNVVDDATRVMLRLKALFRARGIPTRGTRVYQPTDRAQWLAHLSNRGARLRAEALYAELDVLRALRPKVKAAMLAEARRDPAWTVLRSVPFLGPVRVALLLATMQTPWRFRTKRQLWAYAGLAVVTRSSADYTLVAGRPVRRPRAPLTRGLNPNHNRLLKNVFKSAATAATARPGPLQTFYQNILARGGRAELARVTLTRKLAALTLHLWKTGERYDPTRLTPLAH
jgi:transposase